MKWLSLFVLAFAVSACGPSGHDGVDGGRDALSVCSFERPPFIARADFKNADGSLFRELTLFGLHAKPNHAYQELQLLGDVYRANRGAQNILLGDFNADCGYLSPLQENALSLKSLRWLIGRGTDTNTSSRTSCAYDRILDDDAGLYEASVDDRSRTVSDHHIVSARLSSDLRIAAFNMQRFNSAKAASAGVAARVRGLIADYDLIFLQEITSSSLDVLDAITPVGYTYVASPELGRTSYKERYAYMYRADRVVLREAFVRDATGCSE